MTHILTVVAQREATTLTPAILNQIRNAVRGAPPVVLSPGEAADIPLSVPLDHTALRAAIENKPIDAIVTKARGRRNYHRNT
jgi:phosphoserine phosphatase